MPVITQDKVELFPAESLATKMENMTVRLKRHKGLMKTVAVIAALMLSGWLYREFHSTIIFHTPQESKYLGKIVCTADGDLDFWKLDIYLDEDNCYQSHSKTEYCCGLRHILQSKTDK